MNLELAKWIALAAMTWEHLNRIVLPGDDTVSMLLGRLCFPIFALMVGWNAVLYSRDRWRFVQRLLMWGCIAQPFSLLAWGWLQLNVLFTLALGLLWIECVYIGGWRRVSAVVALCTLWWAEQSVGTHFMEYGSWGALCVACAYLCADLYRRGHYVLVGLCAVVGCLHLINANACGVELWGWVFGIMAIVGASGVLLVSQRINVKRAGGWFWYAFYPGHLLVLLILKIVV